MKLRDKIIVWIRLKMLKADGIIKQKVMEGIKKAEREETLACSHPSFKRILDEDTFYQCTTKHCGLIVDISQVPAWPKKNFKKLMKAMQEKLK